MIAKHNGVKWLSSTGQEVISIKQTECGCGCGLNHIEQSLVDAMFHVEQLLGNGLYVTSGCRCEMFNASVGGSSKSKHITGRAVDIAHLHFKAEFIATFMIAYSLSDGVKGVGYYPENGFVHIDNRMFRKYWLKLKKQPYSYMSAKKLLKKVFSIYGGKS